MSDTPITDAGVRSGRLQSADGWLTKDSSDWVLAERARYLERELAAAQAAFAQEPIANSLADRLERIARGEWSLRGDEAYLLIAARRIREADSEYQAIAPYLKEDESPAECVARNRKDVDSMLGLLAKERFRVQEAELLLREANAYAPHTSHARRIRAFLEGKK